MQERSRSPDAVKRPRFIAGWTPTFIQPLLLRIAVISWPESDRDVGHCHEIRNQMRQIVQSCICFYWYHFYRYRPLGRKKFIDQRLVYYYRQLCMSYKHCCPRHNRLYFRFHRNIKLYFSFLFPPPLLFNNVWAYCSI